MTARPEEGGAQRSDAEIVLQTIQSRRVVRDFTPEPLTRDQILKILTAGRWAATAGNRRINRFLVIQDPRSLKLIRPVAPGIWARPTALIIICVDLDLSRQEQVQVDRDPNVWIDVGTQAMNMMIAAHALGIGSCPATSFSRSGLAKVLNLPSTTVPEFILELGVPSPAARQGHSGPRVRVTAEDLTYWERYGESEATR